MKQLVELMDELNTPAHNRLAIIIQWGFSLRCKDMESIQRGNFATRMDADGKLRWTVTVPKCKQPLKKAVKGRKTETHDLIRNPIAEAAVTELLKHLDRQGRNARNSLCFPGHDLQRINPIIQSAAEIYEWNSDNIIYDGSHCLRRGGINEACGEVAERLGVDPDDEDAQETINAEVSEKHSGHGSDLGILPYLGTHAAREAKQDVLNRHAAEFAGKGKPHATFMTREQVEERRLAAVAAIEAAKKALADTSKTTTAARTPTTKAAARRTATPGGAARARGTTIDDFEHRRPGENDEDFRARYAAGLMARIKAQCIPPAAEAAAAVGTSRRRTRSNSAAAAPSVPPSTSKAAPKRSVKK